MFVNSLENFFLFEINGFSNACYLILLNLTLAWILIIFIFYEKLIAFLVGFYLNKLNTFLHINLDGISVSFVWFSIHLKEVCISCQDFYFKCDNLVIELNKYAHLVDRLFVIKFNCVSLTLIETKNDSGTNSNLSDLAHYEFQFLTKCLLDMKNFNMSIYNSERDYLINVKLDRFVYISSKLANNLEQIKQNRLVKINKLKLYLNKHELIELDKTQIKLKESLSVASDYIGVNIDMWNDFSILFLKETHSKRIFQDCYKIFKFKKINLIFKASSYVLFQFSSFDCNLINFDSNYYKLDMFNLELKILTYTERLPILGGKMLKLEFNNQFDIVLKEIKLSNLDNLVPILFLHNFLLLSKQKIQIKTEFNLLIQHFDLIIDTFQLRTNRIMFKSSENKQLIMFDSNTLSIDSDNSVAFFEKLCFEAIFSKLDTKAQVLISPILCGESDQINLNSNKFLVSNLVFISVIQIRYHSFHNPIKMTTYTKQIELILGDIFGTLDLEHLKYLINLCDELMQFFSKKLSLIFSNESYSVVKLQTSLIHVNLIEFNLPPDKEINSFGFNFVISPLNYSKCDLHSNYYSNLESKLSLKLLCSLQQLNNDLVNLIQFGSIDFNVMNSSSIEISSNKIDDLKELDSGNKFLSFLWSDQVGKCACSGDSRFFSFDTFKVSKLAEKIIYKPSLNFLNTKNDNKYGFGQSIIVPSEMCFYSYMKFFKNLPEPLNNSCNYKVISFNESNLEKKKFEPYEIGIYTDFKLNKFLNDNVSLNELKTQSYDILTSNFNSANMSPPYFSRDFSVYIRYLPAVSDKSYSSIADYEITDRVLKRLGLFDTKLLKESEEFLQINESNHSLARIESNLSITNVSLNQQESIFSLNTNNLILEENDNEMFNREYSDLPQFTYNLKQINIGFKLNTNSLNEKKIAIEHLQLESLNILNKQTRLFLDSSYDSGLSCLVTPLGLECLSLIFSNLDLAKLIKNDLRIEIEKIKLRLIDMNSSKSMILLDAKKLMFDAKKSLIKLADLIIDIKQNVLLERYFSKRANLAANHNEEWFGDFYKPVLAKLTNFKLTLQVANLIVLNVHNSIDKIVLPELELINSISNNLFTTKLLITEILLNGDSALVSSGALFDLFNFILRLNLNHVKLDQGFYTFKLVIKQIAFKIRLLNFNSIHFKSNQFELTYSNDLSKLKRFILEFKLNFKIDFCLFDSDLNLISTEFFLDQTALDTNIVGDLTVNSSLNETNRYFFTFTLPLTIESKFQIDLNDKIHIRLPGLLGYLSHSMKDLIFQLIEINEINLSFDFNSIDFECTKLRLMRSSNKKIEHRLDFLNMLSRFFNLKLENESINSCAFKFNSKQTLISYFIDEIKPKKWLLIKLENLNFEYDFKNDDNELFLFKLISSPTESEHFSLNDELSLRNSLCLRVSSSAASSVLDKFDFKTWLDFVSLSRIDAFNYKIEVIAKCTHADLEFHILNKQPRWKLNGKEAKIFLNARLFELVYTDLVGSSLFSLSARNYEPKLDDSIMNLKLYDFNGSQLVADKDLNYLDKNQIVCLVHRLLLLKSKNMFLLIGLIKRNNNTNATQKKEKS